MEVIRLHHPYSPAQIPKEDVVLVLGFFDGVHRGHQAVIQKGRALADENKLKLAVMTFDQHPSIVFRPAKEGVKYLTSEAKKLQKFEALHVDIVYIVSFTSAFAQLAPQAFVDQYLVGLHAKMVVSGFDYTYGKKEVANVAHLPGYARARFDVVTVSKKEEQGQKISSTHIRQYLNAGQMEAVAQQLGEVYETTGTVVHGDARGRLLGFPTANIQVPVTTHLPKIGVYAVQIKINQKWYQGMGSIGHNATFGAHRILTIEVNIFDFDAEIYGEEVTVRWFHYLRDQITFTDTTQLIAQLKQDEQETKVYFS